MVKGLIVLSSYFLYELIVLCILNLIHINISKQSFIIKNIYMFVIDIIYLSGLIYIYRKDLKNYISKFKKDGLNLLIKYAPVYLIGLILMGISNTFLTKITGMELSTNEENVRTMIKYFPIYMIFSSAIYAPIVEELIFRKSIKDFLKNKTIFIITSGIIFGLIHVISSGNESVNELLMGIPYMIMGIDFAYIYVKSDNIFTTMCLHSIHNSVLLIIQFIGG